jgi:hypothetical protein
VTVRGTAEQAVHHSELLTGRHLIQTPFRLGPGRPLVMMCRHL